MRFTICKYRDMKRMPTTEKCQKKKTPAAKAWSGGPRIGAVKSAIKTQVRKVRQAVAAGDIATGRGGVCGWRRKKLDRAGIKRVIHPNAARRGRSRGWCI